MRATGSGIAIGLALALLVPMGVVGQEEGPSADPSVESSPSVDAVVSPEATCPPVAAAATEYEALVAEFDVETAAAIDDWGSAKGSKQRLAAVGRADEALTKFYIGAKSLDVPTDTQESLTSSLSAIEEEYAGTLFLVRWGGLAFDNPEFPRSDKAVKAIGSALAQLDPCAVPAPTEASPEADGTDAVVPLSIDDLIASEMKPKGRKAIIKAVEKAYASDPSARFTEGVGRKAVIKEVKRLCPKDPNCANLVGELFGIYAATGNSLFYEAAEMVWAASVKEKGLVDFYQGPLRRLFAEG